MSVTLTYEDGPARVRIDATGFGGADYATVERAPTADGPWTIVQGGASLPITGDALVPPLYDYVFTPDTVNYYRVRGHISSGVGSFVAYGATATALNGPVTAGMPAGIVAGDLLVVYATARDTTTSVPNPPAGWAAWSTNDGSTDFRMILWSRRYQAGDTIPTVTFPGGSGTADVMAQACAVRGVDLAGFATAQVNVSAQNIARPTGVGTIPQAGQVAQLFLAWKKDDWTSISLAGTTNLGTVTSTAGGDAGQAMAWLFDATQYGGVASSWTVTGGTSAISYAYVDSLPVAEYITEQSATITPTVATSLISPTTTWLRSVPRAFLNMSVDVVQTTPVVTEPARAGVFDVVGRTMPVAVADVRKSRRWTMLVRTTTQTESDNLDALLASGDILYVQTTGGCGLPAGYVLAGDATVEWHPLRPLRRRWTVPVVEVQTPDPAVVSSTATWRTVLDRYVSWAAVVGANATWADVLALTGDPAEVYAL